MPRVGLYDDPMFRMHDAGEGHPERPERLEAIRRGILHAGLEPRLEILSPRPATRAELARVHTPEHVCRVASTKGRTERFDADTQAGPRSYEAALLAAGAALDAVDRVLDGSLDRAFCVVRPPGHHAEADQAMGFCLFNNVAVAAAHALERGLRKVMIVDFDVHHGNGTQNLFYRDPRVLYLSSHAAPFYPGTGALGDVGEGEGRGFTVNLPMPGGLGDAAFARIYREIALPVGKAFGPELLLVSAGFDAHRGDPLAPMDLTQLGYAELMDVCLELAKGPARDRIVVVLEGGYSLPALAQDAAVVVRGLLGESAAPAVVATEPAVARLLEAYRRTFRPFWPVLS